MNNIETILKLRECSKVRRCHTIPHQGEYTVGKHSFDCVTLLLTLFPDAPLDAIKTMLLHDLGERWVGDMPCVAGWDDGALGAAYRNAENNALERNNIKLPALEPRWAHVIRLVDKLELWIWSQEQLVHGNASVQGCINRLSEYFDGLAAEGRLPVAVAEVLENYEWRRTS